MPRITISVISPNLPSDGEILTFDLAPNLTVLDLKGFIQAETNIDPALQQFFLNSAQIQGDSKTLEQAGINDGDMLAMMVRQPQQQQQQNPNNMASQQRSSRQPARPQQQQQGGRAAGQQPGAAEIETARLSILGNPAAMAQVRSQRPALAEVINDPERFREAWQAMTREDAERTRERQEQMRLLNEDPFNIEAQKKIEEMIRQESVQENLQFAYEHNPEVFGRVTMLYIPVEVNKRPVKAFVDSGAQTTIMSPTCAEACGIMRLVDTRYSGVAKGVGTARILGRVHAADIKIGPDTMSCSFTVMEGKDVDLLLGLDMLKRFQAVIDLRRNKLVFGANGIEVEFLGEADLPKFAEEAMDAEPTISGPNGTEIGAQSGTVKPAGTSASASSSANFRGQGQALGSSSKAPVQAPASQSAGGPVVVSTPAGSAGGAGQPAQKQFKPEDIEQLVSLGFSRPEAIQALEACDGNVEYAAGLLFQG